ncbi:cell envelope-related function transcriptional attenuator common domain protein [Cellulomonas aerilata]|uniref:Cell envelope-related function transcriptional attenuator common domain protein n=1 Tax=Cellulomonas aerilata TaxID=515326 RepID=A0A512DHW7_9CELL|nr:cell envelope-related function transcriptional attenuator common domain protein [Cellulomonas aerilata]
MLYGTALGVTALLAFGVTGAASAYTRLQGNIRSVDVTELLGENRPTPSAAPDPDDPNAGRALNILLIGSDVREGENAEIGGEVEGMRSDTTIVMHVSADRSRVELVSIPRDTLVDIPACNRSDGTASRSQRGQFNAAFSIGSESGQVSDAAVCTIATVEENTGVFIDDYVVIDFAGFIRMIDALGGVPMCIPNDMSSPKAGLELTAGNHVLDGSTALAFARARTGTGVGDGSDTDRLGRQQQLLAATVQTVQSKNLLTDVPQLLSFLNAATSSITASPNLASIPNMTGLAFSLRATLGGNIAFMTVPFATAPSDPNRVVMTDEADLLWSNMSADLPLVAEPPATPDPASTPDPAATPDPAVTTPPVEAAPPTPGKDPITADDVSTVCG